VLVLGCIFIKDQFIVIIFGLQYSIIIALDIELITTYIRYSLFPDLNAIVKL